MDGTEHGESWKGIDTWYFKTNSNGEKQYYWGGGVEVLSDENAKGDADNADGTDKDDNLSGPNAGDRLDDSGGLSDLEAAFNYNNLINHIPDEWKITLGDKVKIAILDAGFNIGHPDLSNSVIATYNAIDKSADVSPDPTDIDHGSCVAGLVSSKSSNSNGITGIAPASQLILIKISDNGHISPANILEGLDYALNTANADIINLSLSLDNEEFAKDRDKFLNLFNTAAKKGIIIIASAGENSGLLNNHDTILQPANEDYCLSIGTVNEKFLENNTSPIFNSRVNYLMPYMALQSCAGQEDTYANIDNSSMAAAVLTGTSALLRSFLRKRIEKQQFAHQLNLAFSPFATDISQSQLSIYSS